MRAVCLGIPILLMMSSVASAGNFTISYRNGKEVEVKKYQDRGQSIILWRYGGRVEVPKTKIAQIRDNESGALKIFAKPYTTAEIKELRKRQAEVLERLPAYRLPIIQAEQEHQKELELKRQQLEEQRRQEKQREREEELRVLEVLQKQREPELREQQLQEQRQHQQRLEAFGQERLNLERQRLNESRRGYDTIERRVYIQERESQFTPQQKELQKQLNEQQPFFRNQRQKAIQEQQKAIQKYKKHTVQQCRERIQSTCAARGIGFRGLCESLQKRSCGP
jgi:hypothetical protein